MNLSGLWSFVRRNIGGRLWMVEWSWRTPWTGDKEAKMLITVTRLNKTSDGIFGMLSIKEAAFNCVTEENLASAIPKGTYQVTYMWSDHFQQIMPHVLVPGRTAIEIHWANWPQQLEGCLALGTKTELLADQIDESKAAWIEF